MKKNVAIVLPYVPVNPVGGVIVVFQYAEELLKRGNNVFIYYKTDMIWNNKFIYLPKFIRKMVAQYATLKFPNWYGLNKGIKKYSLFEKSDIKNHDIIIATGIETAEIVSSLPNTAGDKFYFIQGFENWGYDDNQVLESYKLGMNNIVISKWLSNIVEKETGKKPFYVPDGIDNKIFYVDPNQVREPYSITFHYRKDEYKGCIYAIRAVESLKVEYPNLNVTIVSKEKRTDVIPEWCHYVENATLDEVAKINNRSQIFICSSISEGFGLPGLEAMACGCALCTTDYLGGKEYAKDEYNCLVSPIKNVELMVKNIKLMFENKELREFIVQNGIKTAMEFSGEKSADKFINVLFSDSNLI